MARRNHLIRSIIVITIVAFIYLAIVPLQRPFVLDVSHAHALLVQGDGFPSTGSFHQPFMEHVVPNLVVYDNGLVLFACQEYAWPQICYRQIPQEQVEQITRTLDRSGFLNNQLKADGSTVGPHGIETIAAHTSAGYGEVHVEGGYILLESTRTAQTIVSAVLEDLQAGKHLYQPDYVGLWVHMYRCVTINRCNDETIPIWPFEFSPQYEAYLAFDCDDLPGGYAPGILELPQPIEMVRAALGTLRNDHYYFRYNDLVLSVEIRPYLPGESRQMRCANKRWDSGFPNYDTLPFPSPYTTQ